MLSVNPVMKSFVGEPLPNPTGTKTFVSEPMPKPEGAVTFRGKASKTLLEKAKNMVCEPVGKNVSKEELKKMFNTFIKEEPARKLEEMLNAARSYAERQEILFRELPIKANEFMAESWQKIVKKFVKKIS